MKIGFDYINPLDGLVGRLRYGPLHRFTFDARGGFSGVDAEILMRQYGIRIWGREMDGETERAFLVKQSQAAWAEYVLCRAGVPLTSPQLSTGNATARERHDGAMMTPWQARGIGAHSFVDHAVDWVERVLG